MFFGEGGGGLNPKRVWGGGKNHLRRRGFFPPPRGWLAVAVGLVLPLPLTPWLCAEGVYFRKIGLNCLPSMAASNASGTREKSATREWGLDTGSSCAIGVK